jgi:DNA recombination protein RmuC
MLMSDVVIQFIFPLFSLIIGLFLGYLYSYLKVSKSAHQTESKILVLSSELEHVKSELIQSKQLIDGLRGEKNQISITLAHKQTEGEGLLVKLAEQKQELEKLQERFTKDFELLANKILEEKSTKFTEQNKENLKTILSPLQEKILLFEKKVEDTHKENIGFNASLHQQIRGLREVHEQMSRETLNLTKALKGDAKCRVTGEK